MLVLRVTTSDPDKVPMFSNDPEVTVYTGPGATQVVVPVVRQGALDWLANDDKAFGHAVGVAGDGG